MMNVITNISGRNLEQQLIPWIIILKCLQNSLGWKKQLYQDGILERRIPFFLLVRTGLKTVVEFIGLKTTLYLQLYAIANTLIEDIKSKSTKLCKAASQISLRKGWRSSRQALQSLTMCANMVKSRSIR